VRLILRYGSQKERVDLSWQGDMIIMAMLSTNLDDFDLNALAMPEHNASGFSITVFDT
jgi:hypothetical protein